MQGENMASTRAQLVRWGNSHAVRIPKKVVDEARLHEGQELEIRVEGGRIALGPAQPQLTLEALVERITPENVHGEQDWGSPEGKEPW
jgi:antitoxin MazE